MGKSIYLVKYRVYLSRGFSVTIRRRSGHWRVVTFQLIVRVRPPPSISSLQNALARSLLDSHFHHFLRLSLTSLTPLYHSWLSNMREEDGGFASIDWVIKYFCSFIPPPDCVLAARLDVYNEVSLYPLDGSEAGGQWLTHNDIVPDCQLDAPCPSLGIWSQAATYLSFSTTDYKQINNHSTSRVYQILWSLTEFIWISDHCWKQYSFNLLRLRVLMSICRTFNM